MLILVFALLLQPTVHDSFDDDSASSSEEFKEKAYGRNFDESVGCARQRAPRITQFYPSPHDPGHFV